MSDFSRLQEMYSQLGEPSSKNRDSTVLIIDGMNTFIRVFSVVPALNDNGDHIGGVAGFLRSVSSNIRQFSATRCIVVFDGVGGSLRRRKMYKEYKTSRKSKMTFNRHEEFAHVDDEKASMKRQFARIGEYLQHLPVTTIMLDNIEADDTIAYMVKSFFNKKDSESEVVIVSSDRDYLQLVNDKVKVWSPVKKKLYDQELIEKEYKLKTENYLLYRVLTGDNSDNIPGVKGLGLKTLLKKYPQLAEHTLELDQLLEIATENCKVKKPSKVDLSIANNRELLELNHKLMQLHDVDISSHSQGRIMGLVEGPPTTYSRTIVKQFTLQDGLSTYFKDIDLWLRDGFSILNQYAHIK